MNNVRMTLVWGLASCAYLFKKTTASVRGVSTVSALGL